MFDETGSNYEGAEFPVEPSGEGAGAEDPEEVVFSFAPDNCPSDGNTGEHIGEPVSEVGAEKTTEVTETQPAPDAPDASVTLCDLVEWATSAKRAPIPESYKKLDHNDRAIVRAAAELVSDSPEKNPPSKEIVAASLNSGTNVANLLVAAEALKPEPAGTVSMSRKAARGVYDALTPAKLKGLLTMVDDIRADRAAGAAGVTDERMLADAVDKVAFTTYKTHVARASMPTLGRTLVLSKAAELLGLQADGPEKDRIAGVVADEFMQAYDGSADALRQLPKDTRERLNALRRVITVADDKLSADMSAHARKIEAVRVKEAAVAKEVARQAEVQASLPAREAELSQKYNLLVSRAEPSELLDVIRASYKDRRVAEHTLREAEDYFKDKNADLSIVKKMATQLKVSRQTVEKYNQQLAEAGMALYEQSMGANLAEEASLREAWGETKDINIGEELAKIHARKLFRGVMPMVLAFATESAYTRRGEIAQGLILPADAILCTSFNPNSIVVEEGASPAAINRVANFKRQLAELQRTPTRSDPRGPFIQGVLAHYMYPSQMKDTDSTGDIIVSTATKFSRRSGVLQIMRTAYVDEVLSKGVNEGTPGYVTLERRARLAETAQAGYDSRALSSQLVLQVERAKDARRRLEALKKGVQQIIHPRATPLSTVRSRAEAARRRFGLPDMSKEGGWN